MEVKTSSLVSGIPAVVSLRSYRLAFRRFNHESKPEILLPLFVAEIATKLSGQNKVINRGRGCEAPRYSIADEHLDKVGQAVKSESCHKRSGVNLSCATPYLKGFHHTFYCYTQGTHQPSSH